MSETGASPLVSVVTASFNAASGLRRTVASVAGQDFASLEHVVVDGGSTDGSREFLALQGDRVRWISEPDRGIADALNKGFALARGDYVLVLQAEDTLLAPDSLSQAARHLADGAEIVAFPILVEEARGTRRPIGPRNLGLLSRFQMTLPHQGVLFSRRLFSDLGGFDTRFAIAMDYDLFLRARVAGARVEAATQILSVMPDSGISSRRDWASVKRRLGEFRQAQEKSLRAPADRLARALYWTLYLPYKWVRVLADSGAGK
jgi:GT2 family glycosyltransferase